MKTYIKSLLSPLYQFLNDQLRDFFFACARDITDQIPPGTVLVIAPHPDDETLGCGATIARMRANGQRVRIVVVTDGGASTPHPGVTTQDLIAMRRTEMHAAALVLGVPSTDVVFLSYPDTKAEAHKEKITQDLAAQIWLCTPTLILAPYGIDKHMDHRTVADCVQTLIDTGKITCPVFDYPIWFWPFGAITHLRQKGAMARGRKISTGGYLDTKRAAMNEHASQIEKATWRALPNHFIARQMARFELFFEKTKK